MSNTEQNLSQIGNSLHGLSRLLEHTERNLKGLSEEELNDLVVVMWLANRKLKHFVNQFNSFREVFEARCSPNAEGAKPMIERIKAQFRWRKNDQ